MTKLALYLELKAKAGKERDLSDLLSGAQSLAAAEPGTIAWFAVQFDGSTFAIFDAFNDEAARTAHINGRIPAALMPRVDELLVAPPEIRKATVLADKLPG